MAHDFLEIAGLTDVGKVRQFSEDNIGIDDPAISREHAAILQHGDVIDAGEQKFEFRQD